MATPQEYANRIIKLHKQRKEIENEIERLKPYIMPYVKIKPIRTNNGIVLYVNENTREVLDKDKLRAVLINYLKLSPDVADKVINSGSVLRVIKPYVRVMTI